MEWVPPRLNGKRYVPYIQLRTSYCRGRDENEVEMYVTESISRVIIGTKEEPHPSVTKLLMETTGGLNNVH